MMRFRAWRHKAPDQRRVHPHGKRDLVASGKLGHRAFDARTACRIKLDGGNHLCRNLSATAGMFGKEGGNDTGQGMEATVGGHCAHEFHGQRSCAALFHDGCDCPGLLGPGNGRRLDKHLHFIIAGDKVTKTCQVSNNSLDIAGFLGQRVQRTSIATGKTFSARTQRCALIKTGMVSGDTALCRWAFPPTIYIVVGAIIPVRERQASKARKMTLCRR